MMWRIALLLPLFLGPAGCYQAAFPENQRIEGPFRLTTEWQTIKFEDALEVNRAGVQGLHLVVDQTRFRPNAEFDLEDVPNQANLRRDDGVLVKPQVILIAANSEDVPVQAVSNIRLYEGGLTIGFGMSKNPEAFEALPFPPGIKAFTAARMRSNVPFQVESILWRVDAHPDFHRCGGRRCTWWDDVVQWVAAW